MIHIITGGYSRILSDVSIKSDWDEDNASRNSFILNKPNLSSIETLNNQVPEQQRKLNELEISIYNITNEIQDNLFSILFDDDIGWEMISGVWNQPNGWLEC